MESITREIFDAILEGNVGLTEDGVQAALDAGVDPADILSKGMVAAMAEVGDRFERGDYFVPEMLIAARAMKQGLSVLKPFLQQSDLVSGGKVVIGTVKGDLHDIGKNLVAMMLEGAGYELVDLGTDVAVENFVDAARDSGAQIIAMSALLTTTMPNMRAVIEALDEAGMREKVKVIIGGAPVTDDYSQTIGADGYASDASRAVKLVKELVG
jgi:5-methyltetrahydrofolate--homocysteine methyltransferase